MQYDKVNERTSVGPMQTSHPTTNNDYRQNSDIRRTRTIVLILLSIELIFGLYSFIQRCVDLGKYNNLPPGSRDEKLYGGYIGNVVTAGISIIYVILFLIVVFKYVRIGILIFAWLGLLQLICILIIIILAIVAIVTVSAIAGSAGVGIAASVVIIIIGAIACILTILIVIFSFKLAKLLRMQEVYQTV